MFRQVSYRLHTVYRKCLLWNLVVEGSLADLLGQLSLPTTPDLSQTHGPTQGATWAILPVGHAPLGTGEGLNRAGTLLDPIGSNKEIK